jgi:hypothetical protein
MVLLTTNTIAVAPARLKKLSLVKNVSGICVAPDCSILYYMGTTTEIEILKVLHRHGDFEPD